MVRVGQGIFMNLKTGGGVYNGRACITGVTRTSDRGGPSPGGHRVPDEINFVIRDSGAPGFIQRQIRDSLKNKD